jgi:hypothetical protein
MKRKNKRSTLTSTCTHAFTHGHGLTPNALSLAHVHKRTQLFCCFSGSYIPTRLGNRSRRRRCWRPGSSCRHKGRCRRHRCRRMRANGAHEQQGGGNKGSTWVWYLQTQTEDVVSQVYLLPGSACFRKQKASCCTLSLISAG